MLKTTLDELLKCCQNGNRYTFSSNGEDRLVVTVNGSGTFEEKGSRVNEGLRGFKCLAYHDHTNFNKSSIDPEVFKDRLETLETKPILAHVIVNPETGKLDFGGHSVIMENEGTEFERVKFLEQPVGTVTGAKEIVYDEKAKVNRALVTGYLYEQYCPDVIAVIENAKDRTVNVSVELAIDEMEYDRNSKTMTLNKYEVMGITLLGSHQNPGMGGSKLVLEEFNKVNPSVENGGFNMQKGGKVMDKKFENVAGVEPVVEEKAEKFELEEAELTAMLLKLIKDQVAANNPETDVETIEIVEVDREDREVEWRVGADGESHKQGYTEADGDVTLEPTQEAVSPEDASGDEPAGILHEALEEDVPEDVSEEVKALQDQIDELNAQIEALLEENSKYKAKESSLAKEAILSNPAYEGMLETQEFAAVIAKKDEYSVEEFEIQLKVAYANVQMAKQNQSVVDETEKAQVERFNLRNPEKKQKVDSRYGKWASDLIASRE